ncbi:hypothetical protein BCT61_01965 [Vibrio breoganii]|nr:hypothetical protein BCT82_04685 [Vibrio breoganii]PMM07472.1 hypothetical protein BCT61_01965 [Vibrio breoganii]PMO60229.1 hypothetical protein BCT06_13220 [Vibrio breoganii]
MEWETNDKCFVYEGFKNPNNLRCQNQYHFVAIFNVAIFEIGVKLRDQYYLVSYTTSRIAPHFYTIKPFQAQ